MSVRLPSQIQAPQLTVQNSGVADINRSFVLDWPLYFEQNHFLLWFVTYGCFLQVRVTVHCRFSDLDLGRVQKYFDRRFQDADRDKFLAGEVVLAEIGGDGQSVVFGSRELRQTLRPRNGRGEK